MNNRECPSSGPFRPALSAFHSLALKALASLFLLTAFGTVALATVDATLNTSNFVSGQASEVSIDGVITGGGTSTSINAATLMIRFDPGKVTLSGLRTGSNGWSLSASNTLHLSEGWVIAVLSNSEGAAGQGQTTTGPILYFTVTPADSTVDAGDCSTLELSGSECDMSDQDYNSVYPSDPCAGPLVSVVTPPDTPKKGGGPSPMSVSSPTKGDIDANGYIDIMDAVKAARFAHSLSGGTADERVRADISPLSSPYVGDGKVTADDARSILRIGGGLERPVDVAYTPYNLTVYATGSGRLTLYWSGMPAASAYNVYRSTVSGGPYALVQGSVNEFSYPGSGFYMFTDSIGLTDGVPYYYIVKGVLAGYQESPPTEEASDTPNAGAVPWDSRNRYSILTAFRAAFANETLNNLRVVGPDGTVYDDASLQLGNPDGVVLLGTNQVHLWDGTTQTLPDDFGLATGSTQGPSPESLNLPIGKGPYRRVRTPQAYQGVRGQVYLPPASSVNIVADSPGPPPVYSETAYVYLGMSLQQSIPGNNVQREYEVDAGLQWSPKYQNWAVFMLSKGKVVTPTSVGLKHPATVQPILNLPQSQPRFTAGQSLSMTYYAYGTAANTRQKLSLLLIGDTSFPNPNILRTLGAPTPVEFPLANVRSKRIHAIAQKDFSVRTTGSSISGVQWTSGKLLLPTGIWTPWTMYDTDEDGSFEGLGHEAYVDWISDPFNPFEIEHDISITIR